MAKRGFISVVQSKFTFLLVSLLVLFVIAPLFEGLAIALILLNIFTSVVLVSAVYAVSQKKRALCPRGYPRHSCARWKVVGLLC